MSFTGDATFYWSGKGDDESNVDLTIILLPESQGLEARISIDSNQSDDPPVRYYQFKTAEMRRFARMLLLLCDMSDEQMLEIRRDKGEG